MKPENNPIAADDDVQPQVNDGDGGNTGQGSEADETPALTWESWYDEQDEPVQALITAHTSGLKSALDSERDSRKALEKQLKVVSGKADEGSELRAELDKLTADVESANAKAAFYEDAADPTLGLRDAKAAWVLIQASPDDFTRRGKIDFASLKEAHPFLFEQPRSKSLHAAAGSGTQTPATAKNADEQMNDFIRRARS